MKFFSSFTHWKCIHQLINIANYKAARFNWFFSLLRVSLGKQLNIYTHFAASGTRKFLCELALIALRKEIKEKTLHEA